MRVTDLLIAAALCLLAADACGQVRVKGYTRKDGTYVAPHYRSSPNSSKHDNYSTQGNYNPYTGKRGTVNPYSYPVPAPSLPTYTAPISAYQPSYQPSRHAQPGNQWWANEPQESEVAAAKAAVGKLQEQWRQTDPYYEYRVSVIQGEVASIAALHPSQWAATLEQRYWAIPATKVSPRPAPNLLAQYEAEPEQCEAIDSARSDLEYETRRLLRCAQSGSYTDDCSSEVRRVRNAADELESAVSDGGYVCD